MVFVCRHCRPPSVIILFSFTISIVLFDGSVCNFNHNKTWHLYKVSDYK